MNPLRQKPRLRVAVGLLATLLFTQFVRTMASDLVPAGDSNLATPPAASSSPLNEPPVQPSSQPDPINQPQLTSPNAAAPTAAPSTPSPLPPHAIENQSFTMQIPTSVSVDPRAKTVAFPLISGAGASTVLACISSNQVSFTSTFGNSTQASSPLVSGNMTSNFLVSGTLDQVLLVLNSSQGLRVASLSSRIAEKSATFKFVALSEPSINSSLCSDASMSNSRTVVFKSLGLTVDMKNGNVTLKH